MVLENNVYQEAVLFRDPAFYLRASENTFLINTPSYIPCITWNFFLLLELPKISAPPCLLSKSLPQPTKNYRVPLLGEVLESQR